MESHQKHAAKGSYTALGIELAVDFVIMYLVMYTMIATLDHFFLNLNNAYMTLMMVTPMAMLMMLSMPSMFPSRTINRILGIGAAVVFIASFVAMRTQAAIGDEEFLRSMIPHHSGAILMCQQSAISDPEIAGLCRQIVASQQREIAQMKAILGRY